jgi:nicotinamide riboside kinase
MEGRCGNEVGSEDLRKKVLRICVVGGESTGKTTMCEFLARHFETVWVPEFAREYLDGRDFEKNPLRKFKYCAIIVAEIGQVECDFVAIARGQLERTREAEQRAKRVLFCDTDAIVTYMVLNACALNEPSSVGQSTRWIMS